jgi:hypothetical protein
MYLIYFIGAIISWVIFYYTIKEAVKNGILAAKQQPQSEFSKSQIEFSKSQSEFSKSQIELQSKYEKGQITFDEFQKEWERLK